MINNAGKAIIAPIVNKSFIRVESDEVTYPLHIILRFNLEQKIFNDEIKIRDIPEYYYWTHNRFKHMNKAPKD